MRITLSIFMLGLLLTAFCAGQYRIVNAAAPASLGVAGSSAAGSQVDEGMVPVSHIESWYLYFAIGYGKPYYPEPLQGNVDDLASLTGTSHLSMSIEIPGVYFPVGDNRTLLGGSINGIADRFENSGSSIQINEYLLSVSAWRFLSDDIGKGFFLRGDLGLAWLNAQSSSGITVSSGSGFGWLLGGGYSLPLSDETRLTFNLNYAMRYVESDSYGALSVNIGILL